MPSQIDCSVISLLNSPRRPHVHEHLAEKGLGFQFFDAVDGRSLPEQFKSHLSFWTQNNITRKRLLPGEVGVFASHYSLWKETAQAGRPRIILEDDVFLTSYAETVVQTLPNLLKQFDFVRLHQTVHGETGVGVYEGIQVSRCHCAKDAALAYAISARAARKFVEHADTWPEPVDHYIASTYIHGVDVYVVSPCAAEIQEQFESSIQPQKRTRVPVWLKPVVKPIHFLNKQRINLHLLRQRAKIQRA